MRITEGSNYVSVEAKAEDTPQSVSRRRLIKIGGVAAGAVAVSGMAASTAVAADCDDLDMIREAPVNCQLEQFWPSGLAADLGDALSDAITFAVTNDLGSVLAPAGEYAVHNLEIPAGMRLVGEGPATVLTCDSSHVTAVRLTGDGASVLSLKIEGDQTGSIGSGFGGAVSVEAPACLVQNVTIFDARQSGITLDQNARACHVVGCRILNPSKAGVLGLQAATSTDETNDVLVEGNNIEIVADAAPAITFRRAQNNDACFWSGVKVLGNTLTLPISSSEAAVSFGKLGQSNVVVNSMISVNGITGGLIGIAHFGGSGNSTVGNTTTGCSAGGILSLGSDASKAGFSTLVGNTITGIPDQTGTPETVEFSAVGIYLGGSCKGLVVSGNTVRNHQTGILAKGTSAVAITGNFVEACTDHEVYDLGEESEDTTGWAGISFRRDPEDQVGDAVIVGNQVDGMSTLPNGIRIHNEQAVTCNGNLIRRCIENEGVSRDLVVRMIDEDLVDEGGATTGSVVANQAYVEISTASGGALADLRVFANRQNEIPEVPSDSALLLAGTGEIVSVMGTTQIDEIVNFDAGSTPTKESYAGRRVTLRFNDSVLVGGGGNLRINGGSFSAVDGSTLALICDGEQWLEVARTI